MGGKELIIRLAQSSQSWNWDLSWAINPVTLILPESIVNDDGTAELDVD